MRFMRKPWGTISASTRWRVMELMTMVALLALTGKVSAAIVAQKDSSLFDRQYEMTVKPSTQDLDSNSTLDFVENVAGGGSVSLTAGVATLTSVGASNAAYVSNAAGEIWRAENYLQAQGFTVEVRLKVISQSGSDGAFQITATPAGSDLDSFVIIRATGQAWSLTNLQASPNTPLNIGAQLSNTDDFHVFRLAFDPVDLKFSVWRDGLLLADGSNNTAFGDVFPVLNGLNRLTVGDFGGFMGGTVELDYLRITRGAFAPQVPEPMSLTLLGAAGLLLPRRRGRVGLETPNL